MEIEEIIEDSRNYTIRLRDKMNDFEDVEVEMSSVHLDPKNKFFTHCRVDMNMNTYRTIPEHIKYLKTICDGLKALKIKLERNRHEKL